MERIVVPGRDLARVHGGAGQGSEEHGQGHVLYRLIPLRGHYDLGHVRLQLRWCRRGNHLLFAARLFQALGYHR